jgi:hypothetical protein
MNPLRASKQKNKSPFRGGVAFAVFLGIGLSLGVAAGPAQAAHAIAHDRAEAKVAKEKISTVATKDVEETGSVATSTSDDTVSCERSRKRFFVEGEGWVVRRVTTCY